MAVTNEASGTQAATVGTEHTLATIATAKVLQLYLDISALAAGEHVEVKVKEKVLAAGVTRVLSSAVYSWRDAAIAPIAVSIPIMSDQECVCTLKQIDGTGRSFPWAVKTP